MPPTRIDRTVSNSDSNSDSDSSPFQSQTQTQTQSQTQTPQSPIPAERFRLGGKNVGPTEKITVGGESVHPGGSGFRVSVSVRADNHQKECARVSLSPPLQQGTVGGGLPLTGGISLNRHAYTVLVPTARPLGWHPPRPLRFTVQALRQHPKFPPSRQSDAFLICFNTIQHYFNII